MNAPPNFGELPKAQSFPELATVYTQVGFDFVGVLLAP